MDGGSGVKSATNTSARGVTYWLAKLAATPFLL
jgi:hypothetical protein